MRVKLMVVGVTVIALFATALAYQSSPPDADMSRKQILEQMRSGMRPQPDTSSENWKALANDAGLMLFTDEYGTQRGTLYVRLEGNWRPVALEGTSELGPEVLPLGAR